mgnify:FL=1
MIREIEIYIMLFFIYSLAGWLVEMIPATIREKKFVDRGFLVGPYCPIYGCGVILITLLLQKYADDIVVTFFLSVIICGTLEYLTSYLMEKIFKARWWDYSNNKFNINGRICLETLVPFGIGGVLVLFVFNPFLEKIINLIPGLALHIVTGVLCVLFLIDCIVSFKIILNLKEMTKELKDNTAEISDKVKKIILNKLGPYKRLVNAFPRVKENVKFSKWDDIKKKIEESTRGIKEKIDNSKVEIGEMIDNSKKTLKRAQKSNRIMIKKVKRTIKRKKKNK